MYACLRLISPRESMGFSDFEFLPRHGAPGRDPRRFPDHREVYCYLKDFCDASGLMDAVRLNTRVLRVAVAPTTTRQWAVRSVHLDDDSERGADEKEEVFDAVVMATGHYSQPKLSSIEGMEEMVRWVEEDYRAREAAGVPKKYTHDIGIIEPLKMYEFGEKYCDFARMVDWKRELLLSSIANRNDDRETFHGRADDSENVRKGLQRWYGLSAQDQDQDQAASAADVDAQAMAKLLLN